MPNVQTVSRVKSAPKPRKQTARKRRKAGSRGSGGSGLLAVDFYGTFKGTKEVTAKDLAIQGSVIAVQRVRVEFVSDTTSVLNVRLTDFALAGDSGSVIGPSSPTHIINNSQRVVINYANPNPLVMWEAKDANDPICQMRSSNDAATVTFTGVVWLRTNVAEPHLVS